MKHVAIAILTYAAAVLQTSATGPVFLDPFLLLAAVVLATLSFETALLWAFVFGLTTDLVGSGSTPGTTAIVFVVAAFGVRTIVSQLHERPLATQALTILFFVAAARPASAMLSESVSAIDWPRLAIASTGTWIAACLSVVTHRAVGWVTIRFRQPTTSGGAIGTPVGLEIR